MRFIISITGFVMIVGSCGLGSAEEQKTKGLDMVSDTAVAIIHKANAFFQGDLTWTMPPGKDPYRNEYTVDALGRRVPCATLGKYDAGDRDK